MRTLIITAAIATLAACGSDTAKNKKQNPEVMLTSPDADPKPTETKEEEPVKPRIYSETELMYLAGSTLESSQKAYDHCKDVLANGIYNRDASSVSDKATHALKSEYCSLDEGKFANKLYNHLKSANTRSNSGGTSGSAGGSWKLIDFDVEAATQSSSSMSESQMRKFATEQVKEWKKSTCTNLDTQSTSSFVHEVLSEKIDPTIVQAWESCVAKENKGFFCSSQREGDLISVSVKWVPNDIQKKLLPRVNLELTAQHNMEIITKKVPKVLGTGSGKVISFRKADLAQGSLVDIMARDAGDQVSFACSIKLGAMPEGEIKEDPSCGIEEVEAGTGAVCGVKELKYNKGPVCGEPIYRSKRAKYCGVELYKKAKNMACPGSIPNQVREIEVSSSSCQLGQDMSCPAGFSLSGVEDLVKCDMGGLFSGIKGTKRIRKTCKKYGKAATCRIASNGVEFYKSCRHINHGFEGYPGCRHETFGVVYKTCKDQSFGVKKYKRCFVRR